MNAPVQPAEPGALFLGIKKTASRYDVSKVTIWRWVTAGKFPAPQYLMGHRVWRLDQLEAWEASNLTTTAPPAPPSGKDGAA